MLHLGFPMLHRRHRWMREGLSTYVEPVVRARAGITTERAVWARLTGRMHHGLPRDGDRGLDRTPTWGRVYWGGALYWMLADIGIRRRTEGRKSLRDALVAVAEAGGTARHTWPVERALRIGDAATGTTVLMDLYERMAQAPHPVDLDRLFERLGVTDPGELDPRAPLAPLRRAITRRRRR
jgi:predicted metalloprotease with PDZ domain